MSFSIKQSWVTWGGVLLLFYGCQRTRVEKPYTETRKAMGTFAEVSLHGVPPDKAAAWAEAAFQRLEAVEKALSSYDEESQLSQLNRAAGKEPFPLTAELIETLSLSNEAHSKTRGGFDPTVAPLAGLWKRAAQREALPAQAEIESALGVCGWEPLGWTREGGDTLMLPAGYSVDLGGVAKGYGVDQAAEVLIARGVPAGIVNVGGDLRTWGKPPGRDTFSIGVRHPRRGSQDLVGTLSVGTRAVVTSGDYEQGFVHEGKRYSHVVDPRTGWPAQGVWSVTVLADTTALADALATGLMALGKNDALKTVRDWDSEDVDVLLIVEEEGKCVGYATPGLLERWSPSQTQPSLRILPI